MRKLFLKRSFVPGRGDSTRLSSICPRFECGLDTIYGLEPVSVLRSLFESSDLTVLPIKKKILIAPVLLQERLWRKNRRPNKNSKCVGTDLNRNFNIKWASKFVPERMRRESYQIVHRTSCRAKLYFSSVLISIFVVFVAVALTRSVTEV